MDHSVTAQNGSAITIRKTFSRETSVSIGIQSDLKTIWALLTKASDYPRWNSTVISIEGNIEPGGKIALKSTLDPKRMFKLRIKEFQSEVRLVWGDAMGARTFSLSKNADQAVLFSMTEKMGGPLFPLFAKMIPPFDKSFEQFAMDLKKEAEKIMNIK